MKLGMQLSLPGISVGGHASFYGNQRAQAKNGGKGGDLKAR